MMMSTVNNKLPQVGRTRSPESHSINTTDSPTDSGGGKHSTYSIKHTEDTTETTAMDKDQNSHYDKKSVEQEDWVLGDQVEIQTCCHTKEKEEKIDNPFLRRDSIARTPPNLRSLSMTENIRLDKTQPEAPVTPEQTPFGKDTTIPRSSPEARNLAQMTNSCQATGNKENQRMLPIGKKLIGDLGRQRSNSVTSIRDIWKEEGNAHKRKRQENAEDKNDFQEFCNIIRKLNEDIYKFEKVVKKTYKAKTELKTLSASMSLWAMKLEKKMQQGLCEATKDKIGDDIRLGHSETDQQLIDENQKLRQQIRDMEIKHKKEIQELTNKSKNGLCQDCMGVQSTELRRQHLKTEETFRNFQEVTEQDWVDEIFPKIKVRRENIWDSPSEFSLVLPCGRSIKTAHKIIEKAIEKFGGKEGLLMQDKQRGEVATMVHSLEFPDKQGNYKRFQRRIYCPILMEGEQIDAMLDEDAFQTLKTIKMQMNEHGVSKLAVPEIAGVAGVMINRMLEYLFVDANIEIYVFKPEEHTLDSKSRKSERNEQANTDRFIRTKSKKDDALLIRMEGKTFSEMLRTVKEAVNPSDFGVEIKTIKKTRDEQMLVTVQNGADKMEALKNAIKEKIPEASPTSLVKKKVLHVKGLDEVTNKADVEDAISKLIPLGTEPIEIRALRPAYGNRQNATVILSEKSANILIELGKIKVGWTNCRLVERKFEMKCHRCWETGHTKAECNGPNRQNLCLRCGKDGHKVAQCENVAFCLNCNKEGHQTSNRCLKTRARKSRSTPEIVKNINV